jgi:hypothetical protein
MDHRSVDGGRPRWLPRTSKPDLVALLVLAVITVAIWIPRAAGPLDVRWDGGVYYVLGTSIAEGRGYRLLNEPGDIEAVQYPPLLPLIVALHQWLVGSSDVVVVGGWMRLTYFVIFVLYVFSAYAMLRRRLSLSYALLAATVVFLDVQTNFLSDLCFAEIPFGLATMLFVFAATRPTGPVREMAAGTCAVAAYLLRTAGIALLAAWVLDALLSRQFRTAAIRATVAAVPILGWQAYIAHVERSPAYAQPAYAYQRADYLFYNVSYARNVSLRDPFKPEEGRASVPEMAQRWLVNLRHLPESLGGAVSLRASSWRGLKELPILGRILPWRFVLYMPIVIGLVVLVGVVVLLVGEDRLIGLYIVLTAAAICLTPVPWQWQWPRYWGPVTPFLALALARGLMTLGTWAERFPPPARRVSHAAGLAFVAVILAAEAVTMVWLYAAYLLPARVRDRDGHVAVQRLFFYDAAYEALDAGLDWLAGRARPDDVVAASMPQLVYLRTGLKSVMPPFESDPARVQALLDAVPVRFVVVDGTRVTITRTYALPVIERAPDRWMRVYSDAPGKLEIYERRGS